MIKNFGKVALFALVAVAAGCSSNGSTGADQGAVGNGDVAGDRELGGVDFAFTAVPGLDISSISYDVVDAATSVSVRTGTADVSNADAQAKAFVLLPPGSYIAKLTAAGTQPCVGQTATFVVTAGGSITVTAALTCGTGATVQKGQVFIDATFNPSNSCGITEMFVGPLVQGNASNVTMIGEATPNATFAWTSSNAVAGTLNNANTANASLTCSGLGGTTTLTLTITDSQDIDCTDTQTVDVTCIPGGLCGNSTVNAPEQCDDGNASNLDACTTTCQNNVCGDGFLNTGVEGCDDSNTSNTDACLNTCVPNVCGDGFLNTGVEQCDAGLAGSATCTPTCQTIGPVVCGDGTVGGSEVCDDSDTSNATTACNSTCTGPVVCGNGIVEGPAETCDDGDASNATPACNVTCTGPFVAGPLVGCPTPAGQTCQAANCAVELADCTSVECQNAQICMYSAATNACITQTGAFPISTFIDVCYCGAGVDINTCYAASFVPPGSTGCAAQFRAAAATGPFAGNTGLTNADVSTTWYDNAYEMGKAGLLAYCQSTACAVECGY